MYVHVATQLQRVERASNDVHNSAVPRRRISRVHLCCIESSGSLFCFPPGVQHREPSECSSNAGARVSLASIWVMPKRPTQNRKGPHNSSCLQNAGARNKASQQERFALYDIANTGKNTNALCIVIAVLQSVTTQIKFFFVIHPYLFTSIQLKLISGVPFVSARIVASLVTLLSTTRMGPFYAILDSICT